MTTLFLVLFVVVTLAAIVLPFWRASHSSTADTTHSSAKHRAELVAAYERALNVLRDLDEDYQMGKLAQAEYEPSRLRWTEQGVALLRAIEQHDASQPVGSKRRLSKQDKAQKTLDDAIEQAIASYAQALSTSSSTTNSGQD